MEDILILQNDGPDEDVSGMMREREDLGINHRLLLFCFVEYIGKG